MAIYLQILSRHCFTSPGKEQENLCHFIKSNNEDSQRVYLKEKTRKNLKSLWSQKDCVTLHPEMWRCLMKTKP